MWARRQKLKKAWQKITKTVCYIILCAPVSAFAGGKKTYLPPHDVYSGTRAQGMGNAFVAVADDESAVFANPAGVGLEDGKRSKNILRGASFPNATGGFDHSPAALQRSFVLIDSKTTVLERALNELSQHDLSYGRYSLFPYVTIGRVQAGVLIDEEFQSYRSVFDTPQASEYSTDAAPLTYTTMVNLSSRSQISGVLGFSLPQMVRGLSVGASARYSMRTTLIDAYETSEDVIKSSVDKLKQGVNKTTGYAIDAGALYQISMRSFEPTLALAVHDIGNAKYVGRGAQDNTEMEKMNLVAGMSIRPPTGKTVGTLLSFEAHRLNDGRVPVLEKMRVGVEIEAGKNDSTAPVSFRAGYDLNALSLGVSADLVLFKLDLARYAEKVDGPLGKRQDVRYLARLSIDLR